MYFRVFASFCAVMAAVVSGPSARLYAQAAAPSGLINGIRAIVNDSIITVDDTFNFSRPALQALARRVRSEAEYANEARRITQDAVEQLIDRQLIIDEFKTAGFNFPDSYIDDVVKNRIKREFGGDRLTLMRELRAMGQTYESFRAEERNAFIVSQMVLKNVNQQLIISPRKIEKFYQENQERFRVGDRLKLRMIVLVIDLSRHTRDEAQALAAEAMAKIKSGVPFADVADEYSDDARRFRGGDRGWIENKDADLRAELREVAFRLPAGSVSEVIDLEGALFIVKVEERESAQVKALKDVRAEIEAELLTLERERLQKSWVNRLRQKSFIRHY